MHPLHTNIEPDRDDRNHANAPEPIYPVLDAWTHLRDDTAQVLPRHPQLSSFTQNAASDISPSQQIFSGSDNEPRTLIIPPKLTLPCKQHPYLASAFEDPISSLDTARMFAISPGESQRQQQDMLLNSIIEDIACQETLGLPVITSEMQAQSDQHQVIISTASNAAVAGTGDLIYAVLRYVINVVMTNLVSQSVYGTYITVYTSASVIGSTVTFALDNTIVRFVPTYRVKGEHGLAKGLIHFVVWMTLISGLLFGALFYLSTTGLAHLVYHQEAYTLPLKEVALLVPLIALQAVLASGLQALKAIKLKVYMDRLIQPGVSLVLIGIFYFLGLRLQALILATICGFLASVITGQILLHQSSRLLVGNAAPRYEWKTWLNFAWPMSFNSLIQHLINSTDVLFLTVFATAAQVGHYAVASRSSLFIIMPLLAFNTIFSPLIAEHYARRELEQLASLSKVVTRWAFSLSLPVFLCLCIFHEAILSIFSRDYTVAGIALIILSFGNLVNAGTGSTALLLTMTGHARVVLANSAVTITVNIGLAFLLVPRFNIIGAAVATSLAVIILNIAYLIEVYWILKILTFRWDMLKSVVAGGVASIAGLLLLRIIHVGYGYKAIFGTLALIIPFLIIYTLMLTLLRFSKEDRMVFDAIRVKFEKKPSA